MNLEVFNFYAFYCFHLLSHNNDDGDDGSFTNVFFLSPLTFFWLYSGFYMDQSSNPRLTLVCKIVVALHTKEVLST